MKRSLAELNYKLPDRCCMNCEHSYMNLYDDKCCEHSNELIDGGGVCAYYEAEKEGS
jgi:hypothetical protein